MLAGQLQAQQNAAAEQTLQNKVNLLIAELANTNLSRSEAIDKVYVKSGCVTAKDGSMVCLLPMLFTMGIHGR